jgi:hypothetical protein
VTLFKSEEKRDPAMYRPISLISVISKVYLELVREKLKYAIKVKNILPDEQNAFREKRGCEDNVFIFHEILSIMKQQGRNVYAAYVDIKKAYDRVFIFGLWSKLLKYGINGKLWRVLREIYLGSTSSVKFENYLSAFFETREGLRQGCKLSTDLFSVFVADLVRLLNVSGDGLTLSQILYLCNLFFADDILLLAGSVPELQRLLWILETWCWENRFVVNIGKSGCMRFRFNYNQYTSMEHLKRVEFDNNLLPDVFDYKYCGVWISQCFESKKMRDAVLQKATARVNRELSHTVAKNLPFESRLTVWNQLVRCVAEYCWCIWGTDKWEDMENLYKLAAKKILGFAPTSRPDISALFGELGWWSLKARFWLLSLRFLKKLLSTPEDRILFKTFIISRETYLKNQERKIPQIVRSFYSRTVDMLSELKCNRIAAVIDAPLEARLAECKTFDPYEIVRAYEEKRWHDLIRESGRLETYRLVKQNLMSEPYLHHNPQLTHFLTRLRLSQHHLFINTGRWRGVERKNRVCILCSSGRVEDELHFLKYCLAYYDIRITAFAKILSISDSRYDLWNLDDTVFLRFVLSGSYSEPNPFNFMLCNVILHFLKKLFQRRVDLFEECGLDPEVYPQ